VQGGRLLAHLPVVMVVVVGAGARSAADGQGWSGGTGFPSVFARLQMITGGWMWALAVGGWGVEFNCGSWLDTRIGE
jgi:hypothetical protein